MGKPSFSEAPILNSPYEEPQKHWDLDEKGVPTGDIEPGRRRSDFLIPIPKAVQKRRKSRGELDLLVGDDVEEKHDNTIVNALREEIAEWRKKPMEERGISGPTRTLLTYWQEGNIAPRLFFCQIEAAETFIWLNEVAPKSSKSKIKNLLKDLADANAEANRGLPRLAAKMATGAGKTTVMAMLIAYHTINKARSPHKKQYSNQFLIITPGITIKDRLRVLLPHDPNNYYQKRQIVPPEMLAEMQQATVVVTNYHALKRRETSDANTQQRRVIQGNEAEAADTKETPGQMINRVCREFQRKDKVVVINDEAHHCYVHRMEEKPIKQSSEEKEEAKRNNEAARLWMNGILALREKTTIDVVYDLSATPFFLRGSGYREGKLFPWVVSDFSLMDAIESGVVKLPRVPVKDESQEEMPIYRNLYEYIRDDLPRKGMRKQGKTDPQSIPVKLKGALQALYSHYEQTHENWCRAGNNIPPVLIVVCNNTSTSKLVYDYISGYEVNGQWRNGEFDLFNNVNAGKTGILARPRTLLVDSYQLESGGELSSEFKKAAATEIETFKREMRVREGEGGRDTNKITDADLLREVMNTVGKKGHLGEQVRCVVSVSMLTEGWDTNNVTHILGVRAFGTQLLCEQVVGRALRRINYKLDKETGKFPPEYADILGVPFNFADGPPPPPPPPPTQSYHVHHLEDRKGLEITFPNVRGYRIMPPEGRLEAKFDPDSRFEIRPEMAPPETEIAPIVGESDHINLDALKERRINEVAFSLAAYTVQRYYKEQEGGVAPGRFRDLLPIVRHWMQNYVTCMYGTCVQYLLWHDIAASAAEVIYRACSPKEESSDKLMPIPNFYKPEGSTMDVDYSTTNTHLHVTTKSHINIAACDSDWEVQFCRVLEKMPEVVGYMRNDAPVGFSVPYTHEKRTRQYFPDFIVLMDDEHGKDDLLHLVVEVKGRRDHLDRVKADTMRKLWVPAVNNHGGWGRWAFDEVQNPKQFHSELLETHRTYSTTPSQTPAKRRGRKE